MTANEFRRIALSFPGAREGSHMEHPDFRVGTQNGGKGKIFASLGSRRGQAMVKLTRVQQDEYMNAAECFTPASGAWGRWGCTMVQLRLARTAVIRKALRAAWSNAAPKALLKKKA